MLFIKYLFIFLLFLFYNKNVNAVSHDENTHPEIISGNKVLYLTDHNSYNSTNSIFLYYNLSYFDNITIHGTTETINNGHGVEIIYSSLDKPASLYIKDFYLPSNEFHFSIGEDRDVTENTGKNLSLFINNSIMNFYIETEFCLCYHKGNIVG
jgi:hypothetical protein